MRLFSTSAQPSSGDAIHTERRLGFQAHHEMRSTPAGAGRRYAKRSGPSPTRIGEMGEVTRVGRNVNPTRTRELRNTRRGMDAGRMENLDFSIPTVAGRGRLRRVVG